MKASLSCALSSHHISTEAFESEEGKKGPREKIKKKAMSVCIVGVKLNLIIAI
jgi:hypothetical protein